MKIERYYSEIKKRYGIITRARGPFLYTQKNVRLTDLNQEGGRAILGWDSPACAVFKNLLSKGLTGSFETAHLPRLQKALAELLNGKRKIFLFTHKRAAMEAALLLDANSASVYKPFSGVDYSAVKNVIVAPPLPWTNNFWILATSALEADNAGSAVNGAAGSFGQPNDSGAAAALFSEPFAPALVAAAARSVYDLIAALKVRQEKDFFIYDKILAKFFERRSCWLRPKVPQEKYDDFVLACLDAGVAINPDYNADSIVPFGADKGVLKKMGEIDVGF
ncbi:MAG: hypothetical protein IJS51_02495 [Treponema sp.]|nr:hypothetical protein [Treponema sp.]MBQ7618981.1 hypothetical protein [Treponema sp.]